MKNLKTILLLGAALLAMGVTASANVYTDTNTHNLDMYEGDSFTGQWVYGPIAAGQIITKVETWFKFSSGDSQFEQVHIDLGTGEGVIDKSFTSGSFNFGTNYTIDWVFTSGAALFADASNGFLSYTVKAGNNNSNVNNDFTFNWAKVEVTTKSGTTPRVPDAGATIALMGLGLVALAGAQKKFRLVR